MVQYTFAHRTEGSEMWTHIAKFPERQKNSNQAMKAQSFDGVWSVGLFPFAEKIKELGRDMDASTPLVVDIGGGAGHTSAKIRELCKVSRLPLVPFTMLRTCGPSKRYPHGLCGRSWSPHTLPDRSWLWKSAVMIHPQSPRRYFQRHLCADCVLNQRESTERLFFKTFQR